MLVKDIIKIFQAHDPNDEIWITYITKSDIKDKFASVEYTDENDIVIDTDTLVTDDVVQDVFQQLDNDDYLWERFGETYDEICRSVCEKAIQDNEVNDDEAELWKE